MSRLSEFFSDRIQVNSALIVFCFVSVLLLRSQSAASYSTYLLALVMLCTVHRWNDVFQEKILWVVITLLGYLALSGLWSEPFEARDMVSIVGRALLTFFFVVAIAECQLRGQVRRWLGRAMAVVGTGAVVAAMVVYYMTDPPDGRLNGLGQLDTHVIAALVFGVTLILVLDAALTDHHRWWQLLAIMVVPFIAYAVYLSDSRNAWISVLIGVAVFLLAHRVHDRQRFVAGVVAMGVILATIVAALIANEETRDFILPRGDSYRPDIWMSIWNAIQDQGAFLAGMGIHTPDTVSLDGHEFRHPHNLYLAVLYQGGLVALALFVVVIVAVFTELLKHYEHRDAKLALGVLCMAISAFLLDGGHLVDKIGYAWFLFWFPVGIALGFSWGRPSPQLH